MRSGPVLLVVMTLALPDARAVAQTALEPGSDRARAERAMATLPNISEVLNSGYYLTLQADADSRTGTATVAVDNRAGSFGAALSLTGPLNGSTREVRPLTLEGLSNSSTAAIALHWFRWPYHPDVDGMRQICRRTLQRDECDDEDIADPAERGRFIRLAHAGDRPIVATLGGSIGRESFRFATPDLQAATPDLKVGPTEARTDWAVSASLGRYAPRVGLLLARYAFQRRFEAGSAIQLCEGAPTSFTCRTTTLGPPVRRTLDVGAVEWRVFLPGGRLSVSPSVQRDFHGRTTAVDVPLYFFASPSGGLAGGARAEWQSDRPGVTVAVFIGTAIRVTP